ncbi:MAG: hypothetical protein JWL80_689 [Parcubacteria group bacterium]|nr:hypothetical protein [Parcubacteria group bacterium]
MKKLLAAGAVMSVLYAAPFAFVAADTTQVAAPVVAATTITSDQKTQMLIDRRDARKAARAARLQKLLAPAK